VVELEEDGLEREKEETEDAFPEAAEVGLEEAEGEVVEEGVEDGVEEGKEEGEEEDDDDDFLPSFDFDSEEGDEGEVLPGFGYEEDESEDLELEEEALPLLGFEEEGEEEEEDTLEELGFQEVMEDEEEEPEEEPEDELPLLGFEEEEEEAVPLLSEESLETALEEAEFEAGLEVAEDVEITEPEAEEVPAPLLSEDHAEAAERGDMELAIRRVRGLIEMDPDNVDLHQRLVEYAFRKNEEETLIQAYLELAGCLARTGASLKAKAVYQQILSLVPGHEAATSGIQEMEGATASPPPAQVASSEEYVDLGSMILGDEVEKTTRWKVAAEVPSGDDEADFAKMLGQFKEKVSEHVAADDVSAHHDLGTAYMEMGLYDEAVAEFQMALRASPNHIPTHEVMGRCWMQMGKPDMAVRALERALKVEYEVEDEMIGIYYLMGRAQEDRGNNAEALEFYEKVFSLDINFEDVTERLRTLR